MAAAGALLMLFARAPRPGQVKTRMQPPLTDAEALQLHCDLLGHAASALAVPSSVNRELWLDTPSSHPLIGQLRDSGWGEARLQCDGDIGARMAGAIRDGLTRAERVVLVGSDCPEINAAYVEQAFSALAAADVVFGPALDGGYGLVGMTATWPALFADIPWGGNEVLERSMAAARAAGARVQLLSPVRDVDRPEDLAWWREFCCGASGAQRG